MAASSRNSCAAANPAAAHSVTALQDTTCAGNRSGQEQNSTAGEFTVGATFTAAPGSPAFCTAGEVFIFDASLSLSGSNADRYDMGFFVGQQNNTPQAMTAGKFLLVHGVAIDARGPEPLLLCTERVRNEFHWYTLNGEYVRTVYLPGAFMSRPVIAGDLLLSGVCFGMKPGDYRMWRERGFIIILDKDNRVVSAPGGQEPAYDGEQVRLLLQDQPVFRNVHDVCVDDAGDLYGCQWNAGHVYPYKLRRV